MVGILERVGTPIQTLDMVWPLAKGCVICRMWEKPGPDSKTSVRLSSRFNEVVQLDRLFITENGIQYVVLHVIDESIRWSSADTMQGKTSEDVLEVFYHEWIRIFGAPGLVITDQEKAFKSDAGVTFCQRHSTNFRFTAIRQHPQIISKHPGLLRQLMNRIRIQCEQEGVPSTFRLRLGEATFAKNAMLEIGGDTPYRALLGRTPRVLPGFERLTISAGEDGGSTPAPDTVRESTRGANRVREIAIQ